MADAKPVKVGDVPEEVLRATPDLDREQHILIRRNRPEMPEELDEGPDKDHDTGEYRPATYRLPTGNIRRDF